MVHQEGTIESSDLKILCHGSGGSVDFQNTEPALVDRDATSFNVDNCAYNDCTEIFIGTRPW